MEKRVEITSKVKHTVKSVRVGEGPSTIPVEGGAAVKIAVAASSVTGMVRDGDDLVISFADGSTLRLDGYFACGVEAPGQLTFADPLTGSQWLAHLSDLTCVVPGDVASTPLDFTLSALASAPVEAGGLSSGLLIGLGALGVGAVAAVASGGGGGGGGGGNTPAVDTTPPATPSVAPSNGSVLTGTAEAGSTVRLDLNGDGTIDASVTADASGRWTYTPTTPLANGTTVSVTAADAAGNVSPSTSVVTDSLAPATPFVNLATDNVGAVQGAVASGGSTDDPLPTLSGATEAGASVQIYDNGTLIATVTADATGAWSYTPTAPLTEGGHAFTISSSDALGNTSGISVPYVLTVDLTPPAAPVLAPSDGTTISGTAEAGALVGVDTDGDGQADVFATAAADGQWSVTIDPALADGTTVSATATDAAGNVSAAATGTVDIALDTTPPAVPVLTVTDDQGATQGALASGAATDDATPTLSGSGGEAGSLISIYDGADLIGTAIVRPDGAWTFEPATPLADGAHVLSATATDSTGNVSAASPTFDLMVDTVDPDAPFVDPTNGAGLAGRAEPGVFVDIDIDGDGTFDATVQADGQGNWSYVPAQTIPDDTVVSVIARDAAGNTSSPASVTVDANYPVVPVINGATDDVEAVTGQIAAGGVSNDPTPTLTGIAASGATVTILDNGTAIGTATANAAGAWTFTPAGGLAEGAHSFTVTAVDPYGIASGPSVAYPLTVDLTPPAAPVLAPTDGTTISGTAEAGALVGVDTDGDGQADAFATAAADGQWSVTINPALADGTTVSATATDAAGNVSAAATGTVDNALDTTPPAVPVLISVTDDVGTIQGPLASGASSDDTTPALAGTAEAGVTVSLYDQGVLIGTTLADGSGNWSFTPTLAQGVHSLSLTTTDADGNESQPSSAFALTIDTTPPAAPVIDASSGDELTGTAEAGATVNLDLDGDGVVDTSVQAGQDGSWTYTPATPLPNGDTVIATATDAAGNTSPQSTTTIDGTPPASPAITSASDDTGSSQGALASGARTDDTSPTFSGTAEPGSLVSLYDGTMLLGTATATPVGTWTITPQTALTQGLHLFTATASDALGNASAATPPYSLTIDTAAPSAPSITSALDDFGGVQGVVASGGSSDDASPLLSGAAEPASTVSIYDGALLLGTALTDGTGAWSFTPSTPLAVGPHSFTATATDMAGNVSPASSPYVLGITSPTVVSPVVISVLDDAGSVQGPILAGGRTDDTQPTVSGTGAPGTIVTVLIDGASVGTAAVDAMGNWALTPATALGSGPHSLTTFTTDASGTQSPASSPFAFTVDTQGPAAPAIVTALDNVGSIQNPVFSGGVTDDTLPMLSGTTEPGATVTVLDGVVVLGTALADAGGAWVFTPTTALTEGPHSFTAYATDVAGNSGGTSSAFSLRVDVTAPTAPTIQPTNGTTLTGTAEIGATVNLDLDGNGVVDTTVTANASGLWSFTPPAQLLDGTRVITTATDAAGNTSASSSTLVDRVAPSAPAITGVADDIAPQTGNVANGGSTNDTQPVLTGTAEPGATVTIFDNAGAIGTASVNASGTWTFPIVAGLASGPHAFTVSATDAAGNTGPLSPSYTVTVDTTTPSAPVITGVTDDVGPAQGNVPTGGTSDDTQPAITGTASANLTISVYEGGTLIGTTTASASGVWSVTPTTPLPSGPHTFTAVAVNAAGAASGNSNAYTVTVDTAVPATPVVTSVTDDALDYTGTIASGGLTNDTTPLIGGTAAANATVQVYADGALLGTVSADASGVWTYSASLGEGLHSITAVAVNGMGAISGTSGAYSFTIDATAPAAPVVTRAGASQISGTAEAGASVLIDIGNNGSVDATVTADGTGAWSYTFPANPGNGTIVSVRAEDPAGNISGSTNASVDAIAPPAPVLVSVTDDQAPVTGAVTANGSTNDTTPTFTGTGEAGATVSVRDGATVLGTAQVDIGGNWTFTPTTALATGPIQSPSLRLILRGTLEARLPRLLASPSIQRRRSRQ